MIIGHNVIGFDIPALQKVYPWFHIDQSKVRDTYVMAKLYKGNVKERDLQAKYPVKLFGQHSLGAWGSRLGEYKGKYTGGWELFTQDMLDYCEQDVEVTEKLYQHLRTIGPWLKAEELEHEAQWVCSQIERNGIPFDVDAAVMLYGELIELRERMAAELKVLFPPWVVFQGEVVSKANNRKTGHTIGAVYSKILINEFNPQSHDHVADRLKAKYGWKPTEFTDGGKPKVDEKVLNALDYPEAKPLAELFLIAKRIGQIAEGKEAWLKNEKGGWLYHRLNPNGAVTGRAIHSKPNISQVPKVGSRYGKECRALFGLIEKTLKEHPEWANAVLYGTDVAGLELRGLGHYMSRYDDGAYGRAVIEGREEDGTDVHSLNTVAIGLEPQRVYIISGKQQKGRDAGKTFIYAFLYGAGDEKIGVTVGVSDDEIDRLIEQNGKLSAVARKRLNREGRKGRRLIATLVKGATTKARFLAATPALDKLRTAVETACKRGYLIGLDGRHMHVRSPHSALNTLLQGAGALICKKWLVETDRLLQQRGLSHGWQMADGSAGDYCILIWSHDELQIACRTPAIAEVVDHAAKEAIKITEAYFDIKLPLDVSGKIGTTWRDTH